MSRRSYDQVCGLATALDRVGERWTLLILRELALGPLRFTELARTVGGAPTDVLTKRLRSLEHDGIVHRRELPPPASVTVYELTELGRELEPALLALARWGLNFLSPDDVDGLEPEWLPNALRVMLHPPADATLTLALTTGGQDYALRIADGRTDASRGRPDTADLTLTGTPRAIVETLARIPTDDVEIAGDAEVLDALRAMLVLPRGMAPGADERAAA